MGNRIEAQETNEFGKAIVRFVTRNSVYEINGNMIRRVAGSAEPTPYTGEGWREFLAISPVEVGLPVVIVWRVVDDVIQTTRTSIVHEIIEHLS